MRRVLGSGLVVAAEPASAAAPYVRGAQTVPVYSYAQAIRQTVFVRAPFDSDHDGRRDRIAVDIVRPAEAAAQGVKVPVIMDASPYFQCCGRGNESETKTYQSDGSIGKLGVWYTITVPIDTTDAVVGPGHRVALVLTQSDREDTAPSPTGATVTIDPTQSRLDLPVTGGYWITPSATPHVPVTIATPDVTARSTTPRRLLLPAS